MFNQMSLKSAVIPGTFPNRNGSGKMGHSNWKHLDFHSQEVTGQVRSGQEVTGQVRSGGYWSGQVRSGGYWSGLVRSGQEVTGQVRSGQEVTGQVWSGQVRRLLLT